MCSVSIKFSLRSCLLELPLLLLLKLNLFGWNLSCLAIATTCVGQIVSYIWNKYIHHRGFPRCSLTCILYFYSRLIIRMLEIRVEDAYSQLDFLVKFFFWFSYHYTRRIGVLWTFHTTRWSSMDNSSTSVDTHES